MVIYVLQKKNKNGLPSGNAHFSFTLKSLEHITSLLKDIYNEICILLFFCPMDKKKRLDPRPWPNPNTGKPVTQYAISSRSLPALTELHKLWYVFNPETKRFTKFVPLNIGNY